MVESYSVGSSEGEEGERGQDYEELRVEKTYEFDLECYMYDQY